MAKSTKGKARHYDYAEVMRLSPIMYHEINYPASRQQEGPFQKYWQNFVRNIPFRFNMTNSIGNLFSAGTQQIIEAPVGVHKDMEPNRRRRKQSKKKSSIKHTKERKRSNSRSHINHQHAASRSGYQQLQLQPLGVDENNNMHFYDPRTGSYYALHLVSGPNHYHSHHQQQNAYYAEQDDDDDEQYYDGDESDHFGNDTGDHFDDADGHEEYGSHEHHEDYETADHIVDAAEDYADDVQVVDNWGFSDDDIFGERKFKGKPFDFKIFQGQDDADDSTATTTPNISPTIVTIHKNLLKPETEDDVKLLLKKTTNDKPMERKLKHLPLADGSDDDDVERRKSPRRRIKPKSSRKTLEDIESESVRNILGSFMKDDSSNRRRQSAKPKVIKQQRLVEQPREKQLYFIYPHYVTQ